MEINKKIVTDFYMAFGQKDFKSMNACYSDHIIFSDPVFGVLQGNEVKCMWEMLCKNARNFSLSFDNIREIDHEYITCNWEAAYTYSATGNKVLNKAKAFMKIADGKIIGHSDGFSLNKWLGQAFGLKGKLLGWTGFMKQKVRKQALKNLEQFMQQQNVPFS